MPYSSHSGWAGSWGCGHLCPQDPKGKDMACSTAQGSQAESGPTPGPGEAVELSQDHCERLQVRSNLTPRRDGVKGTQRTRPLLPKRGSSSLLGARIQGTGASQAGTESPLSCVSWGCSLNLSGPPLPLPISRARRGNPSKNPRPAIPGLSHYFPLTFACSSPRL